MKTKERKTRYVVVGNGNWGLWCGDLEATDAEIAATRTVSGAAVTLKNCRHVRRWYGKTGGITSFAAFGPCGSRKMESRIGAPIPSSLILDVKAVHECTPEAVRAIAEITAQST